MAKSIPTPFAPPQTATSGIALTSGDKGASAKREPSAGPAPLGTVLGYSVEHAGTVTGVKRDTIYRAIRRGELTARKIGSRTVILTDDLRAWMLSRPTIEPRQAA
jgi:excisionase family DNA binding protein